MPDTAPGGSRNRWTGCTTRRIRNKQGYVLIVTLWVLVLLGFMVTSLVYQVRVETALERRALDQSTARLAARGGIHLAAARLNDHSRDAYHDPNSPWWSASHLYRDLPIGDARVSLVSESASSADAGYGVDDEESRLNINVAQPEQLTRFPGVSTVLAESMVRFRRELQNRVDPEQRATEGSDPADTQDGWVNGPIRSLDELFAVDGLNAALLFGTDSDGPAALARYLTCVSNGKVNVNSASEAVLVALGFDEGEINSLRSHRVQGYSYRSLDELADALHIDGKDEKWKRMRPFLSVRSEFFRLRAEANLPGSSARASVEAGVYVGGDNLVFTRWRAE